jgi:hypothetical protein
MNAYPINLYKVHLKWAKWVMSLFAFRYPGQRPKLYQRTNIFYILADIPFEEFDEVSADFHRNIRPVTANIQLVREVPENAEINVDQTNLHDEFWLVGVPVSVSVINRLLILCVPNFPDGGIDFDTQTDRWFFSSKNVLTDAERLAVISATTKLRLDGELEFRQIPAQNQDATANTYKRPLLDLAMAKEFRNHPIEIMRLVEKDEDEWRTFVDRRASPTVETEYIASEGQSSCLFDADHAGSLRLSELLSVYETVHLMPSKDNLDWLQRHKITQSELGDLIEMGRVKLVLPYSMDSYSGLYELIEKISPESIVLSRSLAARSIVSLQRKEPLLFAPINNRQRAIALSVLSKIRTPYTDSLVKSYGRHYEGYYSSAMIRGAVAHLDIGIGPLLGNLLFAIKGVDARIEMAIAGAGVEWALGLNSAYIPRVFGSSSGAEFDETNNSLIVASYLSRTSSLPMDPVANRLHTITDGLLSLSEIPPVEVAKNFNGRAAKQFRTYARGLMAGNAKIEELEHLVIELNGETEKFERNHERLSRLKIDSLIAGIVGAQLKDASSVGSVGAIWLYNVFKDNFKDEFEEIGMSLTSLLTSPSRDAVIISRARSSLNKTKNK